MTTTLHALRDSDFIQNWAGTAAQLTSGSWGVASMVGYRGDGLSSSTSTDPQNVLAPGDSTPVDLINNSSSGSSTGGIHELTDNVVALQGSGTADAPHIVIYLDTTDVQDVRFTATLRELDSTTTDQKFAVQYRVGGTGDFVNLPAGAVSGVFNAAGNQSVGLDVTLPAAANNQPMVEIRIITNDAPGSDAMVGIDDIAITSAPLTGDTPGSFSIGDASVVEGDAGFTAITFEVSRLGGTDGAVSAAYNVTFAGSADAADLGGPLSGIVSFADGDAATKTIIIQVAGDTDFEADETFTVTLSAPTGGASIADGAGTGTIVNDDVPPDLSGGTIFINEIHYDNASTDAGEAIEIAAPAGTNLAGWSLVLYSVSSSATVGMTYNTRVLSGIVSDQDDGYGTIAFAYPSNGIQNGPSDGVALVDPFGNVVQFLSYEGTILAGNGPAAGLTSQDIGVSQGGSDPLGFSLQLTGAGATYEDFSWAASRPANFGATNTDQDFIGGDATGLVSIGDVAMFEGDSGVQQMVFTVRRAGGLNQEASVEYFLNLTGSADLADLGPGQPLSGQIVFATGVASVEIVVDISGGTLGEGNETFNVLLANPVGNIAIVDGSATGTILNDDPIPLAIYEIQGEGHRSAYEGQPVTTGGIVTGVVDNGFYLQDPGGDGNSRTSDAIFVFTDTAPSVALGDAVEVRGTVAEFVPGADSLSITELIVTAAPVVLSSGNPLPAALLIGTGGLMPPTEAIEDDGFTSYDPATDGLDFYESMEAMRVTVDAPVAVSNTTGFGETWVLASGGAGATGYNGRSGITVSEGDFNPERIQLDADSDLFAGYAPAHSPGDRLADVTGIMSYSFNSYELLVTEAVAVVEDVNAARETTTLTGGRDHLTIASYNVENLDPGDGAAKFNLLAENIVYSLAAPDIIGLQEVQDANGLGGSDPLSGVVTAQLLIAAIAAIGGPNYVYVEIAPSSNNSTGGEPNGNIRNGYLYNADRVDYVEGSAELIEDPAFLGSRRPLAADFTFNGETVRLINVHFTSRLGSDPLMGANQPAADAGDASRTAQAEAVRAYVNDSLATDPGLQLGVLGDFNGFYFEDAIGALEAGDVFADLHRLLPSEERYTYLFDGNLQAIDHLLVTGGLRDGAQFDAVHINAEQASGAARATDHDPVIGRFFIEAPNEAPVAADDSVAVDEDATTGNLWALLLGNDTDPDPEDDHAIASVDGTGTLGSLVFDPDAQSLRYVADHDAFDALAPGETFVDSFTYTITDQHGLTDTATVSVTVTGVADGVGLDGGNGKDMLTGTGGEDLLAGGNGDDTLAGLGGHDWLFGDNGGDLLDGGSGNDVLAGGKGEDLLIGGEGSDYFLFGKGGGPDVVADYEFGADSLVLQDGIAVHKARTVDADGDGDLDLHIAFTNGGGSVTLLGVSSLGSVTFAPPEDLSGPPGF